MKSFRIPRQSGIWFIMILSPLLIPKKPDIILMEAAVLGPFSAFSTRCFLEVYGKVNPFQQANKNQRIVLYVAKTPVYRSPLCRIPSVA
jgi:hypothetical protein